MKLETEFNNWTESTQIQLPSVSPPILAKKVRGRKTLRESRKQQKKISSKLSWQCLGSIYRLKLRGSTQVSQLRKCFVLLQFPRIADVVTPDTVSLFADHVGNMLSGWVWSSMKKQLSITQLGKVGKLGKIKSSSLASSGSVSSPLGPSTLLLFFFFGICHSLLSGKYQRRRNRAVR